MTTITPPSSAFKTDAKQHNTSLNLQTPEFSKQPERSCSPDRKGLSSKKKVLFTPRPGGTTKNISTSCQKSTSTLAYTDCYSSSSSVRTISKNNNDSHSFDGGKRGQSFTEALGSTPISTNKKASKTDERQDLPNQKFGKRKIQYIDSESETEPEKMEKIERSTKKHRLTADPMPTVSKVYLYNSSRTQIYCFPVFHESDLKYNTSIQGLLKETDIDNDCETENEILEFSMYQAKKDLVKGLQMQREEELKARKVTATAIGRFSNGHEAGREKQNNEKEAGKDEANSFWTKVSQTFRDLFTQESRKSF